MRQITKTTSRGIPYLRRKIWDLLSILSGSTASGLEEQRKRSVLTLFLMIGIATTYPFAVHHVILGNLIRATLLFSLGSVQLASLVTLRFLRQGTVVFRVNVLLLGAYFLFLIIIGGTHGSRILWTFVFPLFSFFLLGKREGLFWSALFFLLSLIVFLSPATFIGAYSYEEEVKTRFLITYAVIVLMSYIVESIRQRYQDDMEQIHLELEGSVRQRTAELRNTNEQLRSEIRDRILAEDTLKAAEQEKEIILGSLLEHVIYEDRSMNILWANRAACESAGKRQDEIIGRQCYEIWPQRESPCPDCPVKWAMETGKHREVEKTTPDGRTWLIRGHPVRGADDEIVGGIEVTLEITERKKTEAALKEAYRILNMSPATAFLWRNEEGWPVEFVTDNVEDLFGYSVEDFVSGDIPYSQTIHPDDLDRVGREVSFYSRNAAADQFTHEPYRILTREGQGKWVEDRTHIRRDEEGTITHYQGIVVDITDRERARDALKESEERFRILVEKSPLGVSLIGRDGRYRYLNPKFVEIFGYGLEEIPTGKEWMEKAYPDPVMRQEVSIAWKEDVEALKAGELWHRAYRVTCKDGTEKYISFRSVMMETGDVLIIYEDTTDQKRLETQLLQAQKMDAIGTLAGGVAHDFNNLLMGIQGRASLMLAHMDPSDTRFEHLRGIEDYVRSAADLTKQLLGFARGGKYEVQATDLNALVDRSADLFGRTKKEITIHRMFQPDLRAVEVDRIQMEQVLLNLFVNAWQAMPAGGEIYLQTRNVVLDEAYVRPYGVKSGDYIKLSVTDTGVGMDEETRQRLFDPFFTTKGMGRGTGLGLASAYGIIKNHGGIITVHSEKGQGSTFNIYLPASTRAISVEKGACGDLVKGVGTILLVDDEEMILEVGGPLLQELGYEVLTARSGEEAIEVYQSNMDRIEVVVVDMIMPQMSGGETFDHLKAINPEVKVLLSSGYSINGQAQEILNRGCEGFIQKPFNLMELSQMLRALL